MAHERRSHHPRGSKPKEHRHSAKQKRLAEHQKHKHQTIGHQHHKKK